MVEQRDRLIGGGRPYLSQRPLRRQNQDLDEEFEEEKMLMRVWPGCGPHLSACRGGQIRRTFSSAAVLAEGDSQPGSTPLGLG